PEHITVLDDGAAGGLPLVVRAVEDHGRFRIIAGTLSGVTGRPLKIRIGHTGGRGAGPVAVGATLRVSFAPEHISLYRDHRIVAAGDAVRVEEPA
ncbi:MAG: TOBE domain-containing protein, partial [Myxococcales bacterium]|nr:TOBE domain-containing protein [Myxococcales bacterium]